MKTKTTVELTERERRIADIAGFGSLSAGIRTALHFWMESHPGLKRTLFAPRKRGITRKFIRKNSKRFIT